MRLGIMAVLLFSLACGNSDSSSEPTNASIAGTWTLTTINGSSLPYLVSQTSEGKAEITAAVVTISSNGTWSSSNTTRTTPTAASPVTTTQSYGGTYTLAGNVAALKSSDGSINAATFSGNSFTIPVELNDAITTWRYTKQ